MQLNNLEQYYINQSLIQATAGQIIKDFAEFSFEIKFEGTKDRPYDELFDQMKPILDYLLEKEQEKLLAIIYRIDLNENEFKQALVPAEGENSADILTDLIIKRELKKVLIRQYYSTKKEDV